MFRQACDLTKNQLQNILEAIADSKPKNNLLAGQIKQSEADSDNLLNLKASVQAKLQERSNAVETAQTSNMQSALYQKLCPTIADPGIKYDRYYYINVIQEGTIYVVAGNPNTGRNWLERRNTPGLPINFGSSNTDSSAHWRFEPVTKALINRKTGLKMSTDGTSSFKATTDLNAVSLTYECEQTMGFGLLYIYLYGVYQAGLHAASATSYVANNPIYLGYSTAIPYVAFYEVVTFQPPDLLSVPTVTYRDDSMDKWVNALTNQLSFGVVSKQLPLGAGFLASLALGQLFPQPSMNQQLAALATQLLQVMTNMIIDNNVLQDVKSGKNNINFLRKQYLNDYMAEKYVTLQIQDNTTRMSELDDLSATVRQLATSYEQAILFFFPDSDSAYQPTPQNIKLAQSGFRYLVVAIMETFNIYQEALLLKAYSNRNVTGFLCTDLMMSFQLKSKVAQYNATMVNTQNMLINKRIGGITASYNSNQYTCQADDPGYTGALFYFSGGGASSVYSTAQTVVNRFKQELTFDMTYLSYSWEPLRAFLSTYYGDTLNMCNLIRDPSTNGEAFRAQFISFPDTAFLNG